jgi:hypothetical protein
LSGKPEMVVAAWSYDTRSQRGTAHFCDTVPRKNAGSVSRYYKAICGRRLWDGQDGSRLIERAHDQPKCKRCVAIAAHHRELRRVASGESGTEEAGS